MAQARIALALLLFGTACNGTIGEAPTDTGDEGTESVSLDALTAGQRARVTANSGLNLRTQPSTSASIITTMPNGATVDVLARSSGWFSVSYNGRTGWAFGDYLEAVSGGGTGGGTGGSTSSDIQAAIDRARSGVGFSYHWGGGCWNPSSSSHGACYGSCPNCTHSGTWGADCSGYVSKIWQVPGTEALTHCSHPYNTTSFYDTHPHWRDVPRSSAKQGDALVRHGHIFLFSSGDPWGSMNVYEAKGCSYGIVYNARTGDSSYKVIRRNGY